MTQPIQSLQRFQKKYMKITFKKSVLWGRRETELREKKEKKKKKHFSKGTQKITKLSSNVLFPLAIEDFLSCGQQTPAKMLRVLNDFSGWKNSGTI